MKKIITTTFLLIAGFTATSQVSPYWVKFSDPANYQNFDVKEVSTGLDSLGNIYTAASMYDSVNSIGKSMLVKYNPAGTLQWIQRYNNPNTPFSGTDIVALLVDKAGNSYACGYGVNTSTSAEDFVIIKYDNTGNQVWIKYWDGGQNAPDYATCAAFDASGNILIAGYVSNQGGTWDDMAVVKFSTGGTQLCSYTYNNSAVNDEDRVIAISSDLANNIFITGSSYGSNKRDMITIKLNSSGVNQWTNRIPHAAPSEDERGYGITTDATGNSYVTGATSDWIVMKYSPTGTTLWTYHYIQYALNRFSPQKIMLDKYNNVVAASDVFHGSGNFSDLGVFKLSSISGLALWTMTYNNAGVDDYTDAGLDTSANVYVSGYFEGPSGADMSIMTVSNAGQVIWHSTYSNGSNAAGSDRPFKLAVDKNRNIILAGIAETRGSGSANSVDVITLKFSALVTGIAKNELKPAYVTVYPNPTSTQISISTDNQELIGSALVITNAMGQLVKQELLKTNEEVIDLRGLAKGVYMLTLTNSTSVARTKIIIQ